jgi:hypothetical protein
MCCARQGYLPVSWFRTMAFTSRRVFVVRTLYCTAGVVQVQGNLSRKLIVSIGIVGLIFLADAVTSERFQKVLEEDFAPVLEGILIHFEKTFV